MRRERAEGTSGSMTRSRLTCSQSAPVAENPVFPLCRFSAAVSSFGLLLPPCAVPVPAMICISLLRLPGLPRGAVDPTVLHPSSQSFICLITGNMVRPCATLVESATH